MGLLLTGSVLETGGRTSEENGSAVNSAGMEDPGLALIRRGVGCAETEDGNPKENRGSLLVFVCSCVWEMNLEQLSAGYGL